MRKTTNNDINRISLQTEMLASARPPQRIQSRPQTINIYIKDKKPKKLSRFSLKRISNKRRRRFPSAQFAKDSEDEVASPIPPQPKPLKRRQRRKKISFEKLVREKKAAKKKPKKRKESEPEMAFSNLAKQSSLNDMFGSSSEEEVENRDSA